MFKSIIEGKKAVIFDLDGTIVDTEPFWLQAFDKVLSSVTDLIDAKDSFAGAGEPMYNKWARIMDTKLVDTPLTIRQLTQQTEDIFVKLVRESNLEPKEGFWEFIHEIKNERKLKIALTTNTDKRVAEAVMSKCELDNLFDLTIFGDDVKNKKPNPDIYLLAAKQLNIKPQEAVVFEDSINGANAAYKAGMNLVIIWDTETNKNLFPRDVLYFLVDFTKLAGNLDHTYAEAFEEYRKTILDKPQRTQKPPRLE